MKTVLIRSLKLLKLYSLAIIIVRALHSLSAREHTRRRRERTEKLERLKFYSQFIKKGDLCFDVGANLGNRTEVFRKLGATTVAVEPQDICVKQLRKKYRTDRNVIIVPKALGEKEGEAEMMLSDCSTLSSMSRNWIDSTKASGRFSTYRWDRSVIVPVTTLDKLIKEFGKPVFCKIDVEGYEFEVLRGLSQPVKVISFEFATESVNSIVNSIKYLSSIGMAWFNYSVAESMVLSLGKWVKAEEICDIIRGLPNIDRLSWGDVYARDSLD
jgi:FkbM family methyltransferase